MQSHRGSVIQLRQEGSRIVARCPGKLNLFLEVTGKRPDGYHDLETLVQFVDICDRLVFERSETIEIVCDHPDVPRSRANIVWKAAERLGVGARVTIEKRIPVGGGMGGGSSNAAAAILALDRLYGLRLSEREKHAVARELGADVPMFLHSGTLLCRGIGDEIEEVAGRSLEFVVAHPGWGTETARIYRAFQDLTGKRKDAKLICAGVAEGDAGAVARLLFNRLEKGATAIYGKLAMLRETMKSCGAILGSSMTGSGSCFFGIVRDRESAYVASSFLRSQDVVSALPCRSIVG